MEEVKYEYHVALSYAKEDRIYVDQVAEKLTKAGIRCFYDLYEQANLWGKDLFQHLHNVYSKQAKFTIIFISKHYAQKIWTNHELKSAQSRAIKENGEYILPVRFDETELPGLSSTTAYLDLKNLSVPDFVKIIISKLELPKNTSTHVGYSYIVLQRSFEEKSRNDTFWTRFWRSDKWDYQIPIGIYLDATFIKKIANGGELFIETTPGKHKIRAYEIGQLWEAAGDAGVDVYDVTVDSGEHEIDLKEGKNTLYLSYASGHVEDNVRNRRVPLYFNS